MHPCCHNPTGSDLTPQQWDQITEVAKARRLIPFLDIAYQGFAKSMDDDVYAIRTMAQAGLPVFVSNSFSKIFGLYGDRVGGLSIICQNQQECERVFGQLKAGVRRLYSSPPSNGAKIVEHVLTNDTLRTEWLSEVESMRQRIFAMRRMLVSNLKNVLPEKTSTTYLSSMVCLVTPALAQSRLRVYVKSSRYIWLAQGVFAWRVLINIMFSVLLRLLPQ